MATENDVAAFIDGIGVMCQSLEEYEEQLEYWTSEEGIPQMEKEIRAARSNKPDITQEELAEVAYYDSEKGHLCWKVPKRNAKVGKRIGSISERSGCKHQICNVMGKHYYEHRLIWLLVYGHWPDVVDHIDGNGLNNKLENLRNVSHQENTRNAKRSSLNTSGHTGVWQVRTGKWVASIGDSGVGLHLGTFTHYEDAVEARKSAEKSLGYHENHGKRR